MTGLVQSIDQHITQELIAERGRGMPPERPVLSLLLEFCEEKLCRAAVEEDWLKAVGAMLDLRSALQALVTFGHAEFVATLQQIDGELLFLARSCRHRLLTSYLDTRSEERAAELHTMLLDLGQSGYWPTLRQDMDDELWGRAMSEIDRLRRERA